MTACDRPPAGWRCTRGPLHPGPCAAVPASMFAKVGELARQVTAVLYRALHGKDRPVARMERTVMAVMPHCDQRVLHAPGECEYCDAYPAWQEARRMWGIAYTGQQPTPEQPLPCPSLLERDLATIEAWPGNRPERST